MRGCLTFLLLLTALQAGAQAPPALMPEFPAIRPDLVIYVKGHGAPPDDPTARLSVQISMVDPEYPAETLEKQVQDLCVRLGSPPTGLAVTPYVMGNNPNLKFLQATFGTAGLVDSEGNANLSPLVQAFAGVETPFTVKGMAVFYSDFDPPIKGPKTFTSAAVRVFGRKDQGSSQVEYAIELLSQNPGELRVETKPSTGGTKPVSVPTQNSSQLLLWCLILIGGVAAGALVYFLLVKRLSGSPSSSVIHKP